MKALVTGASGFVGSHLAERLAAQGFEVFALMRKTSQDRNLSAVPHRRIEGSLSDEASLRRAVEGMDFVFHVAGAIQASGRDAFFESNGEGTRRLVEATAAHSSGLRRFVYVSSLAAGGPGDGKQARDESHLDQPVSNYGESKRQGELELLKFRDQLPVVIVRPPVVYGPRDRGMFVIARTVSHGLMPLPPSGSPDRKKYYSVVHVADLVEGIILAATAPSDAFASGEVFYLSGDGVHHYEEMLQAMAEPLGVRPWKFGVPKIALVVAAHGLSWVSSLTGKKFALSRDKLNEILPDYWVCSNEKAKTKLGFLPRVSLKEGMRETIAWYREHGWLNAGGVR